MDATDKHIIEYALSSRLERILKALNQDWMGPESRRLDEREAERITSLLSRMEGKTLAIEGEE